ncbi:MAG: phosphoglycerate kinase [bacterium]|nr:phosphoglycerate kinase [bacterium]
MKIITPEIVKNKKVLIRLDLDVPIENNQVIDLNRLSSVIPTLEILNDASQIIIIGHLGRPNGQIVEELRMTPIATALTQYIGSTMNYIQSVDINDIKKSLSENNKWNLLENIRFNPQEEQNNFDFSKQLASLGQIFVFEAFATSHRAAASTVGITSYLPSYAGLRVAKEIQVLSQVLNNPEHPFLAIIGGSKIETKIPVIENLLNKADFIYVGGKLIKEINDKNIKFSDKVHIGKTTPDGLDITPESQQQVIDLINQAKLIVWNGPPGKFEDQNSQEGTKVIAQAIANSNAYKIIGGGETNEAVKLFNVQDKFDFISVGGGAMLEFLSGKELPALQTLNKEIEGESIYETSN